MTYMVIERYTRERIASGLSLGEALALAKRLNAHSFGWCGRAGDYSLKPDSSASAFGRWWRECE